MRWQSEVTDQKYQINIFLVEPGVGLAVLRAGSCEVVVSVQPQLNLLLVSVVEHGMIHATARVLVARVVAECRVELEGEPVRTTNVYTENLNSSETTKIY